MKNILFFSIVIALVLSSCSTTNPRYVSSPSVPNTTFFRQKGDMKFTAAGSLTPTAIEKYDYSSNGNNYQREKSSVYGFDGQAAFALTDHFMVAVDGVYRSEWDKYNDDDLNPSNDRSEISYKRTLFNAGVGFYAPLGRSQKSYFNFLATAGMGNLKSNDNGYLVNALTTQRYYNANLFKIGLSPSFNFFFTDYFRMSVMPRFSFLNFNNISTNYTAAQLKTTQYEAVDGHYMPLFEPSLMLQAGFPGTNWLKMDLGFHLSSDPDIGAHNLNSRNFLMSFGLSFYPFDRRRW